MEQEPHVSEYHDSMVALLEWIWGRDYMAPGGEGNVDKMVEGIDLDGRRVLDIGCGIGGPAFALARKYGAHVTGIDLEPQLIGRATRRAAELGLSRQTDFRTVSLGALPFPDASFDLVFTSGALTQTEDKAGIAAECFRVLKPGGVLTCYDWLKDDAPISDDMRYFFKMEGLTYNLITLAELSGYLEGAGFADVTVEDASAWYRRESRREYERMRGEGRSQVVELIGEAQADHMIEDWRSLVVVCEKASCGRATRGAGSRSLRSRFAGYFLRRDVIERDDPLAAALPHQPRVDAILRVLRPVELVAAIATRISRKRWVILIFRKLDRSG